MIAVDTNILVYAHRQDAADHFRAKAVIVALAEGDAAWIIPFHCVVEFLAVVTHAKIYKPPSTIDDAIGQITKWMKSPSLTIAVDRVATLDTLTATLRESGVVGPAVHDAQIAALCKDYGVTELWSADRGFSRFPSLNVINPVA